MKHLVLILFISLIGLSSVIGQQKDLSKLIDQYAQEYEAEVIEWRRHFHQYPELSNREFNTAKKIIEILEGIGDIKIDYGIAHTGVIGVFDTGRPGPTIGLRADIDALPVIERVDLPFASKETTSYLDKDVGVMHACGHDTHIAMLLGVAKLFKEISDQLNGKFVYVFQPAEEGAPKGEEGGARLMVKEGIFETYGIEAFFGQHISSGLEVGKIRYKTGGIMAASDRFEITIKGKQTHGSRPWGGIDPITIGAQMILALQNIVSRETELTKEAAVISVGKIESGVRNNIIPEELHMIGTIRTLDIEMQDIIHSKIRRTVNGIAEAYGAEVDLEIGIGYPVTKNDLELTKAMIPALYRAAGEENVIITAASTGAEDFSFFANKVPSLYWFTGGRPSNISAHEAKPHHTPDFFIDESGMITGVKAMANVVTQYMVNHSSGR